MAVRNGIALTILLEKISLDKWNTCTNVLTEQIELPDMDTFYQKLLPELSDHPLLAERLHQRFLERQLTQGLLAPTHLLELLEDYCQSIISDTTRIYRDEILNDLDSYVLPAQYKFAVRVQSVLQLMENEDYAGCIPLLAEALHLCPRLSVAVSGLTKYLTEKLANPPQPVSEEFKILGAQVKQMLYGLMKNGQWTDAYSVNTQLLSLLPDDLEVLRLKQNILRRGMD